MSTIASDLRPLARDVADLMPDPKNSRKHGDRNMEAIKASLRMHGQRKPIVARPVDGRLVVVAGNGTLEAAKALGWQKIAVSVQEMDDATARAFGIQDNRSAELAEWDQEVLAELLGTTRDAGIPLEDVGFSDAELLGMLGPPPEGEDPGPSEPPEHPESKLGELYELGPHRLLCGDSTNPDHVARVMNGQKATLMATDPPYLVDYDVSNHPNDHHKKKGRTETATGNEVGNKRWDDYNEASANLFRDFLRAALPHLTDDAPIYQWHACRRQALVEQAWVENGLLVHQTIVWVKPRGVLTRSHFLWAIEPCFYGWKQGYQPQRDRRPPSNQRNVWELDTKSLDVKGVHPTQKPLEVCRWPIAWHTKPGEICFEPFGGSGTCMISAAMEGRRCYSIELSPAFVDVIRKRWTTYARSAGIDPGPGAL